MKRIGLATRKGVLIVEPNVNGQPNKHGCRVRHEAFAGSHASIIFLDPRSGHLFCCLDDGHFGNKLYRWDNFLGDENWHERDQSVWNEIAAPKYPEGEKLPNGNDAVLKYQWGMATGSPNQPGRLYLGTEPGGLFVSNDHGDHFELVQSLWNHPSRLDEKCPWFGGGRDQAGIHSICVDPRDENTIRVGISCAGVFVSKDGGKSWQPKNKGLKATFLPDPEAEVGHDPHLLVQAAKQPDWLWQQNHCGVFCSSDSGETWHEVSEDGGTVNFGFGVAVDPDDGKTAWVVPAVSDMVRVAVDRAFCVCRTTDGGKTWDRFHLGLPQNNCYDFALRHCLVYLEDCLAVGTACGSLYYSSNRGEAWTTLASHLPPIYCVAPI